MCVSVIPVLGRGKQEDQADSGSRIHASEMALGLTEAGSALLPPLMIWLFFSWPLFSPPKNSFPELEGSYRERVFSSQNSLGWS